MSAADWNEYGSLAMKLVGKPLRLSLATNSIKLQADLHDHRKSYLWVDPPWELLHHGERSTASADYPHHEDPDYRERHVAWGQRVAPLLDGAVLIDISISAGGGTQFSFADGRVLTVGCTDSRATEYRWYDDWYAKP